MLLAAAQHPCSNARALPTEPQAQEAYRWRPVAIGGGGFITGQSGDALGRTRVVRTDVYGAYRWDPARDRWLQLVTTGTMPAEYHLQNGLAEGVYEIAVAPSDPERVYMAMAGVVFRSSNGGRNWVRVTTSAPFPVAFDPNSPFRHYGPFLAVSPVDPDVVVLGTPKDGVWASADGGANWWRAEGLPPNVSLRDGEGDASPGHLIWFEHRHGEASADRIWAMVVGLGMFSSADGARSFARLPHSGPGSGPTLIRRGAFLRNGSFFGVDPHRMCLWAYRDGAWEDVTRRAGLPPRRYAAIAANPLRGVFLFDEGGRTYHSLNDGESWRRLYHQSTVGAGDPPWLRVSNQSFFATGTVDFDPVNANTLWACAGTGVFRADVASVLLRLTWVSQSRGIEELVANDAVHPPGGLPLFAGWDFGIHVKADLDAFSTTYKPRERVLVSAQQVDWCAADPRFLVTNASDARMCCAEDGDAVLAGYSKDGGVNWQKFATLPLPPGTRRDDSWRMSFGSIAVAADDPANIVWMPSFRRSPFFTRDMGRSWQRVEFPGERLPLTGSHPDLWVQRKVVTADRVRPGTFYLVHSGGAENEQLAGLWVTVNGGLVWQRVYEGEIAPHSGFAAKLRAVPGRAGCLFFTSGVADAPDTRLRFSSDGGRRWSIMQSVTHVDDVAFGKAAAGAEWPAVYISGRIAGDYGIWRSVDAASSWERLVGFPLGTLDQVTVVEADKEVFGRVYLGYKGSGWIYGQPASADTRAATGQLEHLSVVGR